MTQQIINYINEGEMKKGKKDMAKNGFRSIHTDFINNINKFNGYRITFDNTPDPPPPPKRQLTQIDFILELAENENVEILGVSSLQLITIKDTRSWWKRNFG